MAREFITESDSIVRAGCTCSDNLLQNNEQDTIGFIQGDKGDVPGTRRMMKKPTKILLAILGGIDVTIYIFTPIILATLWATISNIEQWNSYFFYGIGFLATLFRAIKIGFMK